eukprot:s4554_g7.t1
MWPCEARALPKATESAGHEAKVGRREIWHDIYVLFIAGSKQHLAASFHAWSNASCPDEVKVPTSPASLEASPLRASRR